MTTTTDWTDSAAPKNLVDLTFLIPPRCQGQMVERAYAIDGESGRTWRRTTDRSDQSVSYEWREILEDDDPINYEPR